MSFALLCLFGFGLLCTLIVIFAWITSGILSGGPMPSTTVRIAHKSGTLKGSTDRLIQELLSRDDVLCTQAAKTIERMKAERAILDRRIRKQRAANRDTWEIVENRRKWLGSDVARRQYCSLLTRYRALLASVGGAAQ